MSRRAALLGLLLAALLPAVAQPLDEAAERGRIVHEREAARQALHAQEAACQQRFAVTACIDDARRAQRETLERLRREQSLLDEAARKRRAAQRMATIHQQLEQREALPAAAAPTASAGRPRVRVREAPRAPAASASAAAASGSAAASVPQRSAAEAQARARFEQRQREAHERRAAAERRAAERAAAGRKPAAPLPLPASSPP